MRKMPPGLFSGYRRRVARRLTKFLPPRMNRLVVLLLPCVLFTFFTNSHTQLLQSKLPNGIEWNGQGSLRPIAIPRMIHFTFKSEGELSDREIAIMRTCATQNPGWLVVHHTDSQAAGLIKQHFPDLWKLYMNLPKNVERADLFRYAVLYHYGGLYVDTDVECVVPIDKWLGEHVEFVVGVENVFADTMEATRRTYARVRQYQQWAMLSIKAHPVMRLTLNKIIENYYRELSQGFDMTDRGTLERTGPGIWTDAVSEYVNLEISREWDAMSKSAASVRDVPHLAQRFWVLPRISSGAFPDGGDLIDPRTSSVLFLHHFSGGWKSSRVHRMGKVEQVTTCYDEDISLLAGSKKLKIFESGARGHLCTMATLDNLHSPYITKNVHRYRSALETEPSIFGYPITILSRTAQPGNRRGPQGSLVFVNSTTHDLAHLGTEEDASITVWGKWEGYTGHSFTVTDLIGNVAMQHQDSGQNLLFFEFGSHSGWLSISLAQLAVPTVSFSPNDQDASKLQFAAHLSDLQQYLTVSTLDKFSKHGPEILLDFSAKVDADAAFAFSSNAAAGVLALEWCVRLSAECLKKFTVATLFAPTMNVPATKLAAVLDAYLRSSEGFDVYYSGSICEYIVRSNHDSGINYASVPMRILAKLLKMMQASNYASVPMRILAKLLKMMQASKYTGVTSELRKHTYHRYRCCQLQPNGAQALARLTTSRPTSDKHVILIVRRTSEGTIPHDLTSKF